MKTIQKLSNWGKYFITYMFPNTVATIRTTHADLSKVLPNHCVFEESINEHLPLILKKHDINADILRKDMIFSYFRYGITPDEYYMHDFPSKDNKKRDTILSQKEKDAICIRETPEAFEHFSELKDKWEFYSLAKDYFKRDVCRVELPEDFEAVKSFCHKHDRFIAKPRKASCGIGVHVVDMSKFGYDPKAVYDYYINYEDGCWLFEELIKQSDEMAVWHPSSVNTIRIPSIRIKNDCVVILPLFRTGKNGNLVDNCHNDGGLMAVPDEKTGIIISEGYDVFTNTYEKHVNSNMTFKGWQVPKWAELIETAKNLHLSLPKHHKFVGFDFALTDKGWVVVEGNWGNFPHQVCVNRGIRKDFEKLMKSN